MLLWAIVIWWALESSNPVVLIVGFLLDYAAFIARRHFVGDEDEFNAQLQRDVARRLREGPTPEEEPIVPDAAEWLSRSQDRFYGVPPAPIADEEDSAPQARTPSG